MKSIRDWKEQILSGAWDDSFASLYREIAPARKRYLGLCDGFLRAFGEQAGGRIFSSPGRTELCGNHTDHQKGKVLTASIDLDMIALAVPSSDDGIQIVSEGYGLSKVNLSDLSLRPEEQGSSIAILKGICQILLDRGYHLGGMNVYLSSAVPTGAGLSSSAAYEVLLGTIFNQLYLDGALDAMSIAQIAQQAERDFFGKPCGLMDQAASAVGGLLTLDFQEDCPSWEQFPVDFASYGYTLCVVETGDSHANLTPEYAAITRECRAIAEAFEKSVLREVEAEDYYRELPRLRQQYGDRAALRALHFFRENKRVEDACQALRRDDFGAYLRVIEESGQSSISCLQNVYALSQPERQGISLALALTEFFLAEQSLSGACRVHGGGFAGTMQCYLPQEAYPSYRSYMERVFGEGSCLELSVRPCGAVELC